MFALATSTWKNCFFIEDLTNQVNEKLDEVRNKMEGAYEILSSETGPKGHCDCILKGKNARS
ncbi:MAG: hypothetical protein COX30_00980 [Candidatus Moranbacteria bacterium CG23_combo_of_CG06-09_8_20_14_all_39_10]|nr:MAG: hypothetical protein COX30_00980 [Candidatus Moranbacteria bacterium CG23_combo_of_CG06-09_8_20_14_all_39_10]